MALEAAELRARLHQIRDGLSAREAAERVGVSEKTWLRWERGEAFPQPGNVAAIADKFNVDPSHITGSPEYVSPLARLEAKLDLILTHLGIDAEGVEP